MGFPGRIPIHSQGGTAWSPAENKVATLGRIVAQARGALFMDSLVFGILVIFDAVKAPTVPFISYLAIDVDVPHYAFARYHLARLLRGRGAVADARREFESFLTDWQNAYSDNPELAEARREMSEVRK